MWSDLGLDKDSLMEPRKKTTCVLCGNLCGLEVLVDKNRIVKVWSDKENPRSQGYLCRKGRHIHHHQHHADRLLYPLKKVGDTFARISWEHAIDEIAEKLTTVLEQHGPRALALMGTGTLASPSQAAFSGSLMRGLGSRYVYNALAQELTGRFWVDGRTYGRQSLRTTPDIAETDMVLIVGKNPMMSHHMQRARQVLKRLSKNPDTLLVVVDPRRSETAKIADVHLAIRPGTDALFYRAMISIILNEAWQNQAYIDKYVTGFERIRAQFTAFDARAALKVCELDYAQVRDVCRQFAARQSCHTSDLGVLMTRHSTLISYLETVLLAVCGRIGVPGGNVFPSSVFGRGAHSDERDPKTWRTVETNFPAIMGLYPPNVMPEEIMSDSPDRLRAVIVSGANPLRSFADTSAYEQAYNKLDLLVTIDIAMTETAALSHYVLPSLSGYESWDGGFGSSYPKVFFQLRRPVVEAEGEQLESAEIFTRLADRLGLIPEISAALYEAAASGDRLQYGLALREYVTTNPQASSRMPFILAKTLGKQLGSVNLAALWGLLQTLPSPSQENAARVGFTPGPGLGEELFQAMLAHPEGLWVGEVDKADNLKVLATEDDRIHLEVPEMTDWLQEIDPVLESEKLHDDEAYPFILKAGNHIDTNANTQMRNPAWNKGQRACTVTMHPADAETCGFSDGQMVRLTTEAGEEVVELEVTATAREGHITMAHGFGLIYQGEKYGANVNRLTKNTHRDRLAATPLHSYVRCRVEG
jgi:anaerobic selenocysteine-containing dehydrogenase